MTTPATVTLDIRGQTLILHPERAVEWPEQRSVIVADTHFGKGVIFRRHGLAVPAGTDAHDRARLGNLVRRVGALRLIVLGDFLHGPLEPDGADAAELAAWCAALQPATVHVIAGNHDRGAAVHWRGRVHWRDSDWSQPPFLMTHEAPAGDCAEWVLSGHVHPVVRLGGVHKRAPRVPVFWQREGGLVLPSFGQFTGGYAIAPAPGERVYAVGPERVVPF